MFLISDRETNTDPGQSREYGLLHSCERARQRESLAVGGGGEHGLVAVVDTT
jgi:hypothetical protein